MKAVVISCLGLLLGTTVAGASNQWDTALLDDCAAGGMQASIGTIWEPVLDNDRGGSSSIDLTASAGTIAASGTLSRGRLRGGPGTAGIMLPFGQDAEEFDINQWDGIRISIRRSGAPMLLRILGTEIENGDHFAVDIPASSEFETYEFPFRRMGQVMSPQMPWRGDRVTGVELLCWSFPGEQFSFELDRIEFYRND